MTKTVLGIFTAREDAEGAIEDLKESGYNPKDVSIVMRNRHEANELADTTGADVAGGAVSGATTGAILGGLAGLLSATVIPGLGAFFIGGPLVAAWGLTGAAASTVSGAATGALAGGLIGALMGLGLSEDEASLYESRINEGAILLAVPARAGEEMDVRVMLEDNDASDIKVVSARERTDEVTYKRPVDDGSRYASFGAKGGKRSRSTRRVG